MKKLIFIAGLLLLFVACKSKTTDQARLPPPDGKEDKEILVNADPGPKAQEAAPNADVNVDGAVGNDDARVAAGYENAGTNNSIQDTSKKLVKNGDIEFETNNLIATRKKILVSLKKYGGYVEEDNQSTNADENRKQYELKVRIPAKSFDFLLDSVSSTAYKIDTKNISVTDETTKYIDIQTRLNNKKLLEKRYLELLNKSSKISDLLEIQNKLTEIRSDIESTQGQLNYLSKQVAYSSLDITFYTQESAQVDTGNGAVYKFKKAIADGWEILQNLFFGLITLWPLLLVLVIFYWLIKIWRKRRKAG
ncbi:protein of unknown function [Mucilaginibacter mallensis]|uniref:DUF4349 domain-containing protein n=1 Tax=Mucilaginibacter mallensis TaxID=652787 RepID=A0A1H2BTG7_MUCMA|nr:DUF4349 domain-containing protein [Mucilaginibacter mallensis]SDT61521.1 protein of unknown function [Mucilaginibacter mallensis]